MKLKVVAVIAVLALSTSCSVALQDSVRSSSVRCDNGFLWIGSDLVIGAGWVFVGSRVGDGSPLAPPTSLVLAGTFAASALIGLYKRHNCVRWQETAPPEVWAAVVEAERQQAAANEEARRHDEAERQLDLEQQRLQLEQQQQQQAAQPEESQQPVNDNPPPQNQEAAYNNNLHLVCNGRVLVDQTFVSKSACIDFAAQHKFQCSGLELPVSC